MGFLASSTITLFGNRLILSPSVKTFLNQRNCVSRFRPVCIHQYVCSCMSFRSIETFVCDEETRSVRYTLTSLWLVRWASIRPTGSIFSPNLYQGTIHSVDSCFRVLCTVLTVELCQGTIHSVDSCFRVPYTVLIVVSGYHTQCW